MVLLAEAVGEAAGAAEEEAKAEAATLEEEGDSSVPPQNQK